jgi:hypothetical protein
MEWRLKGLADDIWRRIFVSDDIAEHGKSASVMEMTKAIEQIFP